MTIRPALGNSPARFPTERSSGWLAGAPFVLRPLRPTHRGLEGGLTIVGGIKSAAVPHPDGSHRQLYCMESPENWFEDFGNVSFAYRVVAKRKDVIADRLATVALPKGLQRSATL